MNEHIGSSSNVGNINQSENALGKFPSTLEIIFVMFAVVSLYILACTMTVIVADKGFGWGKQGAPGTNAPVKGLFALLAGWFPPFTIAWSANLFLLLALVSYEKRNARLAMKLSFIALGTSLTTMCVPFWTDLKLADGYFVWQFSIAGFSVAAWSAQYRKSSREKAYLNQI